MMLKTFALSLLLFGAPQQTPSERLVQTLDAIHGIGPHTHKSVMKEAKSICADRPTYLSLLAGWLDAQLISGSQDPLTPHRVGNALALAIFYCGEDGRDLVATRLKDVRQQRDSMQTALFSLALAAIQNPGLIEQAKALRKQVDALIMAERTALLLFTGQNDDRLVGELLGRVTWDEALQLEMVEYFIAAAPKNSSVKNQLLALQATTRWESLQKRIVYYLKH